MHPTTSPSKTSYGTRTYDSKLVTREMHRLGPAPPGSTSLPNPASLAQASTATSSNDPWGVLHVNLLPLFNGEPLRVPIEELNLLVKRHISFAASSPSKALSTLENDTMELLSSGMVTLNAKLVGIEDDKLLSRVVELWGFFWDQVLTYVEGVLLPLQTDPLLSSLYRTPKRPSSPTRQTSKPSVSSSLALTGHGKSGYYIDVRTVALRSFRDKIILPLSARLYARITSITSGRNQEGVQDIPPRMQQMLLVLASQSRPRPPTLSLSTPPLQLSTGEAAVTDLLRALRTNTRNQGSRTGHMHSRHSVSSQDRPNYDLPGGGSSDPNSVRAPSFLSGGAPRDRRGRIAQKARGKGLAIIPSDSQDDLSGDETPRNGYMDSHARRVLEYDRQKEREFLDSLRSPDLEPPASSSGTPTGSSTTATVTVRASVGGWGLGAGNVDLDTTRQLGEDDEDEPLDWDQAQAVVERMVGMTSSTQSAQTQNQSQSQESGAAAAAPPSAPPNSSTRRRMT